MRHLLRFAWFAALPALLLLAACTVGAPTGPQQRQTATAWRGSAASDTPTATPLPTATPIPSPTPTPLPTPTPVAALSVGSLPAGQVLFSTQRTGEAGEQLWRVSVDDGLAELRSELLPGGWSCAGGEPVACALVSIDQGLFALRPVTATALLLDDLTPLPANAMPISPTLPITTAVALSPTLPITTAVALSPTLTITNTDVISPSAPLSLTAQLTATHATHQPINQSANPPALAFSPSGVTLAVATQDRAVVYDLAGPTQLATLQTGGPAELAWSPDGQRLALAYPAGKGNAVALWTLADGTLRVLAQMEAAGHLAWAPDGSKLAFDARTSPGAPASQGDQLDVYVLYLRSGEIANVTEVFLRNNGVEPDRQIAGWAPRWEADSATLRYVRGVPGRVEDQSVVRHALGSRTFAVLWPVVDEGKLGVLVEPDGARVARVVARDGRDVAQVREADGVWQDVTPGSFADLTALAWAPANDADASRLLLLADRQTLVVVDPATGDISGLAVTCPDCVVTEAVWLP